MAMQPTAVQMDTRMLVHALRERAKALITAANVLESAVTAVPAEPTSAAQLKTGKRTLSAEAKRRIILGQKKRRARERQEAKSLKEAAEMLPASSDVAA